MKEKKAPDRKPHVLMGYLRRGFGGRKHDGLPTVRRRIMQGLNRMETTLVRALLRA